MTTCSISSCDGCSAFLCLTDANWPLTNPLMLVSGICWTIAYLLFIYSSLKGSKYTGPPPITLFMNLSWEFIFSFVFLDRITPQQLIVNRVWLIFDIILLCCFIRSIKKFTLAKTVFLALEFVFAFLWLATFTIELSDFHGRYTAFTQNALMSALFAYDMVNTDQNGDEATFIGHLLPGVLRLIGTLTPSIVFYKRSPNSVYLQICFIACFCFDLLYVILCIGRMKKSKKGKSE